MNSRSPKISLVGLEGDLCAPFGGGADLLGGPALLAALALEVPVLAIPVDIHLEPLAQGVDDADAHAVQTAGHLVAVGIELAAGVQSREDDLQGTDLGLLVLLDGDAAAVVLYAAAPIRLDPHDDAVAVAGQCLVDRVVQHLVNQVVQTADGAVADVHLRPLAHRLHAAQNLDVTCVVFMCLHTGPQMSDQPGVYLASSETNSTIRHFSKFQYRTRNSTIISDEASLRLQKLPILYARGAGNVRQRAMPTSIRRTCAAGHTRCNSRSSTALHNCSSNM